jgi:hypothetical protein
MKRAPCNPTLDPLQSCGAFHRNGPPQRSAVLLAMKKPISTDDMKLMIQSHLNVSAKKQCIENGCFQQARLFAHNILVADSQHVRLVAT